MNNKPDEERWLRIKNIFNEAVLCSRNERDAFLKDACKGDKALRTEVEELIDADTSVDDFLETPAVTFTVTDETGEKLVGTKIGNYFLKRVISYGGMGVVYEAIQDQPMRTVAVKVMKEGLASRSAQRRFEYESEILAKLKHPGIAQVIEADAHSTEGAATTPYFVMEYIPDAKPITKYAWGEKLSVRERLRLFMQTCEAVYHGHQKGIIHRDLKPGNILVDPQGNVKVIDFGIARITDSDLHLTTVQTDIGKLIGTVQYMSPEQCNADPNDLDIRSDVYALGVVLYEMLCELLPYDVRKAAVFEATRLICETPPKKPSTVNRTLRGDLETIVLKALEKNREHRYQTVQALAEDLRRYLNSEVILAKPAGVATKFIKTVKRNPVVSATACVALVTFVTFFLYEVLVSLPQLRDQRNKAVRASEEADRQRTAALNALSGLEEEMGFTTEIRTFLEEMLASVDPLSQGQEVKLPDLLDSAALRIENGFTDRPAIEASLRNTLGTTYLNTGNYPAAEKQLEKAIKINLRLYSKNDERTIRSHILLGKLYMKQAQYNKSEKLYTEALNSCRATLGVKHFLTISTLSSLGGVYNEMGLFDKAEPLLREAHSLRRFIPPMEISVLCTVADHMGCYYLYQGRFEEAEPHFEEAYKESREAFGENNPIVFDFMNNLAGLYTRQGRHEEAAPLFIKALEKRQKILGDEHPQTLITMDNLAGVYLCQKRYEEAKVLFEDVLEKRRRILPESHPSSIISLNNMASTYTRLNRIDKALPLYFEALEKSRVALGDEDPATLSTLNNISCLYFQKGAYKEAEPLMKETLALRRRVLGNDRPETLTSMQNLSDLYSKQGRMDDAIALCKESLEGRSKIFGEDHNDVMMSRHVLAALYSKQKQYDKALSHFIKTVEAKQRLKGKDHPSTLISLHYLVVTYMNLGKVEEAHMHATELVENTPKNSNYYKNRKKLLDQINTRLGNNAKDK